VRCNHRETRSGSVETIASSYFSCPSVCRTASFGSVGPTPLAHACPRSHQAAGSRSSVMAASSVSGSQYGRRTKSVNLHVSRAARSQPIFPSLFRSLPVTFSAPVTTASAALLAIWPAPATALAPAVLALSSVV